MRRRLLRRPRLLGRPAARRPRQAEPRRRSAASVWASCSARRSATCSAASSGRGTITAVRAHRGGPARHLRPSTSWPASSARSSASSSRSAITWPVFLLDRPVLTIPLFAFVAGHPGPARLPGRRQQARLGARHVRRPGRHGRATGRDRRAAPHRRHLGRDRRPHPRRRPGRLPARARCSCPRPCSASCRDWPTPVTTCGAAAAGAASRCSRRCAASRASTSRSSTTRCPVSPRSTPSWSGSASTAVRRCSRSTPTWPRSLPWPASG